jgi:site-specific DNA-methyltransferase (adenine-specific)
MQQAQKISRTFRKCTRLPWEAGPSHRFAWGVPVAFIDMGPKGDSQMATTSVATAQQNSFNNRIVHGNCIDVMRQMPTNSVDFILTDPPYLVNYRDRSGRTIQNDVDDTWLKPAMAEAYRVLKQDRIAVMFYGWTKIDAFFDAWRSAGFRPVGHIVFRKSYSSKSRFLRYQHEQAFLLAKGRPPLPKQPLGDVMEMPYSGNKLHPTQKPIPSLVPLIRTFTLQGETVFDPFAGSGSTCAAAALTGRNYIGVELDDAYFQHSVARLNRVRQRVAQKRSSGIPRGCDITRVPAAPQAKPSL